MPKGEIMARKELESKAGKYADIDTWNKKGEIKEGDELEGYLYDRDSFDTKYGTMYIYVIQKLDGSLIKVVGQKNIVSKIDDSIKIGTHIWFKFTGLVETANGAMKNYKIDVDPEDVKEFENVDR